MNSLNTTDNSSTNSIGDEFRMNSPNKIDNPAHSLFKNELEMYFLISLSS